MDLKVKVAALVAVDPARNFKISFIFPAHLVALKRNENGVKYPLIQTERILKMFQKISIRAFLEKWDAGYYSISRESMLDAGWYDWFCSNKALYGRLKRMVDQLKALLPSSKIDLDKHYVWFKNGCPCVGHLYDQIHISALDENDKTHWCIIPHSGFKKTFGESEVWNPELNFENPVLVGTWKDVKNYFKRGV